jgi:hypothetical protein
LFIATVPTTVQSQSDDKAIAVAEKLMQSLGGEAQWKNTRYLRFDFVSVRNDTPGSPRQHLWDKWTNNYRIEWTGRDNKKTIVLFNIDTKKGEVYNDGKKVDVDSLRAQQLDRAYLLFINDTYWLLMPYKWRDSGVVLKYAGEEDIDGKKYNVVHLSFENVGLTPKDQYWAYVNKETGLMERWKYVLQSFKETDPPTVFDWVNWKQYGNIMLANERVNKAANRKIVFNTLVVLEAVDEKVFASPDVGLP